MIDNHEALRLKTELLCKGLFLDGALVDHYEKQGLYYGRKGDYLWQGWLTLYRQCQVGIR